MLQSVRCRLKRLLAHRVYAERMPAVLTRHKSVARIVLGCNVHALKLLFVRGGAKGVGTPPNDIDSYPESDTHHIDTRKHRVRWSYHV
jgi:hypothetical protein